MQSLIILRTICYKRYATDSVIFNFRFPLNITIYLKSLALRRRPDVILIYRLLHLV